MSALGRSVARWPPRHHVIDDFGDVGGVIARALDVLGDEQKMRAKPDRARIFHHVGEKFAEQAVVDLVDLVVLRSTPLRPLGIAVGIGVEHLLELAQRRAAHAGQALRQPDRRFAVQHQRALGDVLGEIADAFQFGWRS